VIIAVPAVDRVVTSPLLETVAMSVFSDCQAAKLVTMRDDPSASIAVAVSCVVRPRVTIVVP
jgi:hypothetical protein